MTNLEAKMVKVIDIVCRKLDIPKHSILSDPGQSRKARENLARQICMHSFHKHLGITQEQTANIMGYNKHSIVGYSIKKVEEQLTWNITVRSIVREINRTIGKEKKSNGQQRKN